MSENNNMKNQNTNKTFKMPKFKKTNFKHGVYSIGITALILVGIIAFNVLVSAFSKRLMLEYDFTADKVNTINEENLNFIKNLDKEVKITVCAREGDYSNYMVQYAQEYGVEPYDEDEYKLHTSYYEQTVSLINRYENYNKKITVEFMDPQDASFADILDKYSEEKLYYGDIIVSCELEKGERYKVVGYEDIYELFTDDSYSYMNYTITTLEGNNIETALTSAIAYVTSEKDKKVAFITGHSHEDYSVLYRELLETNNYKVDIISDNIVENISSEYDAIFIVGPTRDFLDNELSAIRDFLDNGEKYGKGLIFFANAAAPYLDNLYGWLEEWGIEIGEGILFETNTKYHETGLPTALLSAPTADDEIIENMDFCMTSLNVPMTPAFDESGDKKLTALYTTTNTVVNAPKGTSDSWTDASKYEKSQYATILQSKRSAYDKNNDPIENYVVAFSSTDFVYSDFMVLYPDLSNEKMALALAERAVDAENTGISFSTKVINAETFVKPVTEENAKTVRWVFVIIIPLACLGLGIFVYIRRKNS